ncbi:MAG: hypothetical protein COB02_01715 [Candidatus Cloacimonadota bacterium]|nr:MAG: hypothetical protein COB02_01715 [Candidatus Cloacimonadota bacterium]
MSNNQDVKESLEEINVQLNRVSNGGSDVFENLKDFGKEMENILETVQKVENESQEIRSNLDSSNISIQSLNEQILENTNLVKELYNKINHIQNVQLKVENSIKSLDDIATQTRFLSLNAIIEAGKAGDAGKTFTVIAQEIQVLAEVAANTASTVEGLVSQVSKASDECIGAIESVEDSFGRSIGIVEEVSSYVKQSSQNSFEQLSHTQEMAIGINKGYEVLTSSCALSQGIDLWSRAARVYFDDLKSRLNIEIEDKSTSKVILMDFNSRLRIGINSIDFQHSILVGIINDIYVHLRTGSDTSQQTLINLVEKLAKNTVNHFAFEEEWFKKCLYDEGDGHKKIHDNLLAKVIDFKTQLETNYSYMVSLDLIEFLVDWLTSHILGVDRRYIDHLQAHMAVEPNQSDFGF